jgi:hypothetical protein
MRTWNLRVLRQFLDLARTADGNITDPIRAYEYLRLSSLAMHLLDRAHIP